MSIQDSIRAVFARQESILALKREARTHYTAAITAADDYTCGFAIAAHVSGPLRRHAERFNALMDEIAELDPQAPAFRFKFG